MQNKRRAFKSEEIVPPIGDDAKREGGSGGVTCAGGGMWGRREAKEDEEKQVQRWLGSREDWSLSVSEVIAASIKSRGREAMLRQYVVL